MKLSDYKGEDALDVLADILEPMAMILADEQVQEFAKQRVAPIKYVKPMLKNHKHEVLEILARIEDMPVDEYAETVNVLTLPAQVLSLINDPEVRSLFRSQGQSVVTSLASSGSAMENIEAEES